DAQLEAIRQRRMQELMAQQGGQVWRRGRQSRSAEEQQAAQEAQEAADDQRRGMLAAILQPSARERLARISLVKPDKARSIEDLILNAARRGQIQQKVSEDRLIELLEQVNEQTQQKTTVTIQRRRAFDDDF
ncbi:Programmed cell death protein 5, partial [Auxenochlorella protothecoides]